MNLLFIYFFTKLFATRRLNLLQGLYTKIILCSYYIQLSAFVSSSYANVNGCNVHSDYTITELIRSVCVLFINTILDTILPL